MEGRREGGFALPQRNPSSSPEVQSGCRSHTLSRGRQRVPLSQWKSGPGHTTTGRGQSCRDGAAAVRYTGYRSGHRDPSKSNCTSMALCLTINGWKAAEINDEKKTYYRLDSLEEDKYYLETLSLQEKKYIKYYLILILPPVKQSQTKKKT